MGKELPDLDELIEDNVYSNLTLALHNIHSVIDTIKATTVTSKVNEDTITILRTCENYILLVQEVLTRHVRETDLDVPNPDAVDTDEIEQQVDTGNSES